ncbi:hypothetical protein BCR44DRAFT_23397 [Catenaria anguillulae PL171]|uniref:Uncharacterized protein n=1 Tax=Catenaria anguillulae PL171 TaxID=765915 RepID=A0A1Y2HA64_9FUNG|nr:hypothetical protein BCR44DRAFT_23397 [Catenaria anguillulae PL171]
MPRKRKTVSKNSTLKTPRKRKTVSKNSTLKTPRKRKTASRSTSSNAKGVTKPKTPRKLSTRKSSTITQAQVNAIAQQEIKPDEVYRPSAQSVPRPSSSFVHRLESVKDFKDLKPGHMYQYKFPGGSAMARIVSKTDSKVTLEIIPTKRSVPIVNATHDFVNHTLEWNGSPPFPYKVESYSKDGHMSSFKSGFTKGWTLIKQGLSLAKWALHNASEIYKQLQLLAPFLVFTLSTVDKTFNTNLTESLTVTILDNTIVFPFKSILTGTGKLVVREGTLAAEMANIGAKIATDKMNALTETLGTLVTNQVEDTLRRIPIVNRFVSKGNSKSQLKLSKK